MLMQTKENATKPKTIHDKNGLKFIKCGKHNYKLSFFVENKTISLSSIVNFDLVGLIYKLNGDIFESIHIEKIDDNQNNITLIIQKIFLEFFSQRYAFLNIKKEVNGNNVIFHSNVVKDFKPAFVGKDLESIYLDTMVNKFEIINDNLLKVECEFVFQDLAIPGITVIEKVLANLINKIFFRFKIFVEAIK